MITFRPQNNTSEINVAKINKSIQEIYPYFDEYQPATQEKMREIFGKYNAKLKAAKDDKEARRINQEMRKEMSEAVRTDAANDPKAIVEAVKNGQSGSFVFEGKMSDLIRKLKESQEETDELEKEGPVTINHIPDFRPLQSSIENTIANIESKTESADIYYVKLHMEDERKMNSLYKVIEHYEDEVVRLKEENNMLRVELARKRAI